MNNCPLPIQEPHVWAIYYTLRCNWNCSYCIQKEWSRDRNGDEVQGHWRRLNLYQPYEELPASDWVRALNAFPVRPEHELIITGGEPSVRGDLAELLGGLEGYKIELTTNLTFDVLAFMHALESQETTLHGLFATYNPAEMTAEDFFTKILAIHFSGVVENIRVSYMPNLPGRHRCELYDPRIDEFLYICDKVKEKVDTGVELHVNTYREPSTNPACSQSERSPARCTSSWVSFAPNGSVYHCDTMMAYRYAPYGNILRINDCRPLEPFGEYFDCSRPRPCGVCHFNSDSKVELVRPTESKRKEGQSDGE